MNKPLAASLRPENLDQYIGQKHLVGQGAILRKAIESGKIPSMILWGPPVLERQPWLILLLINCSVHFTLFQQ